MKTKPFFFIALIALSSLVYSCSESKSDEKIESTEEVEAVVEQTEVKESSSPAVENTVAYYGDVTTGKMNEGVESEGRRITVLEFGEAKSKDPEIFEVSEGKKLVYIKTRVENIDAEQWKSSMLQFFLRDASGEEYAPALYETNKGDNLPQVDLKRGELSEGYIGFEVNPEVEDLCLAYAVNLGEGKLIAIDLK
ncbi:DUF4352 domain-containing protein [Mangrovivirga sp. M17]|uniref:DUF4352 domain-containing protein n=1 Tax=Mangrovivirga halotolerans TaxID=2993936 RepID=A0ABT3RPE9_9BACT|nr:DUF4352 domain-containing protein [Mangrovivirga halotolerans]MCX2743669.1 DUF4352 domain-containing protein [Mangrovivirga halotolerans]